MYLKRTRWRWVASGGLVGVGRAAQQEPDEGRKAAGQRPAVGREGCTEGVVACLCGLAGFLFRLLQRLAQQLRHGAPAGGAGRAYQPLHLFFGQAVAGHHPEEERLVVVRDVAQVGGQPVELVVPFAFDGLAACQFEPAGDDFRIGDALEGRPLPAGVPLFGFFFGCRLRLVGISDRFGHVAGRFFFRVSGPGSGLVFLWRFARDGRGAEEAFFVEVEHIRFGHDERRAGIVFHAGVVVAVAQLFGHPPLRPRQVHSVGDEEEKAQALGTGRDVGQSHVAHRSLRLQFGTLRLPVAARVGQVVDVVHRQAAGHGVGVQPPSVPEGGVRGEDGQPLLQPGLQRVILFPGQPAATQLLQSVRYLGADFRHRLRTHRAVEQFGGAFAHDPASYVVAYSKTHTLRSFFVKQTE